MLSKNFRKSNLSKSVFLSIVFYHFVVIILQVQHITFFICLCVSYFYYNRCILYISRPPFIILPSKITIRWEAKSNSPICAFWLTLLVSSASIGHNIHQPALKRQIPEHLCQDSLIGLWHYINVPTWYLTFATCKMIFRSGGSYHSSS